jgi:hypothetical protein
VYVSQNFAAGVGLEFQEPADFLRIIEAAAPDLSLIYYRQGAEVARVESVGEGYFERFAVPFDKVRITSAGGGVVDVVTRLGAQVGYDKPPTGQVDVVGIVPVTVGNMPASQGAFTQAQKTVTSASAQLLAAKANRRYLLVQNNDAAGIIYVNLTGAAATATNGVKLGPGASLEIQGFAPTAEIRAIGSIGSNANIVTVEG